VDNSCVPIAIVVIPIKQSAFSALKVRMQCLETDVMCLDHLCKQAIMSLVNFSKASWNFTLPLDSAVKEDCIVAEHFYQTVNTRAAITWHNTPLHMVAGRSNPIIYSWIN
jgi:hypothetical protein